MALYLSEEDVQQVLTMSDTLKTVEMAMIQHSWGSALDMPRQRTHLPGMTMHMLQGAVPQLGVCGYKIYTTTREHARFWVHLFDSHNGEALAVIEANYLGMMRTGAATGVSAACLARPESRVLGVFGAGWQAQGQIMAICQTLPINDIKVFARNRVKLEKFCLMMTEKLGRSVRAVSDSREVLSGTDVLVTITTARQPLFEGEWLEPGTHIVAAGSNALLRREIDETSIERADIICVDSIDTALKEAGDLLPMLEKGKLSERQLLELGAVLSSQRPGRTDAAQISIFESQGMAIQDLAVAQRVWRLALDAGLGKPMPYRH